MPHGIYSVARRKLGLSFVKHVIFRDGDFATSPEGGVMWEATSGEGGRLTAGTHPISPRTHRPGGRKVLRRLRADRVTRGI